MKTETDYLTQQIHDVWFISECVRSIINFHPRSQDVDFNLLEMFFSFQCIKYDENRWPNTKLFKKRDVIALKRQYIYCALVWHTVFCCVIRRLVTSAGSDETQNYKRIGKSPKYGFSFSKQSKTENNIFSRFWIFSWVYLEKIPLAFCPNLFPDFPTPHV